MAKYFVMTGKKKIKIILEKSALGYYAYTRDFSKVQATGYSVQEVKKKIALAIEAKLLKLEEKGKIEKAAQIRNSEIKYILEVG